MGAFFANLGWRTDARIPQTAEALGLTADPLKKNLKSVELVAQEADGKYQVYLFHLASVTAEFRKGLAQAFKNRGAYFLCVLTDDWETLEVVHFHRYNEPASGGAVPGAPRTHLRPRVVVVERHGPSRVALRVLRRLTWTSSEMVAQYEKIESAYAMAEWSEDDFNNRALFADHYLLERLRERAEWREDPRPAFDALSALFRDAGKRLANRPKDVVQHDLVEPVLAALGFTAEAVPVPKSAAHLPDYRLYADDRKAEPVALLLSYPWDRSLDGKDDHRDRDSPDDNPGARVVSVLEKGEAPWVVVTNGKLWRLYARQAHSRATNYYELDAEEILTPAAMPADELGDAFRYFWLLFRAAAFVPRELTREGRVERLSFLDEALRDSQDFARKLGDRLKERVFEDVFLLLARGFIKGEPSAKDLGAVHQATLTFLYRLLFLFYAEARDLLPVREGKRGFFEVSLTRLKREIAEAGGTLEHEREGKLRKRYRPDAHALYDRLTVLFKAIDQGDRLRDVPRYNGGLFLTVPDADDDSPEAVTARYLLRHKVPDDALALALDLLARDLDEKRHDLVHVDYKSLGVRQLGSIYEGLLEFRLRVADGKLASVVEKGRDVWAPFADLDSKRQQRAEKEAKKRIVRKGEVYLENDRHERKATGSYYTPDHIVAYIVDQAVGPVLQEKFEAMRPMIRAAETDRRAFLAKQQELERRGLKREPPEKADLIGEDVVRALFNVRVLDPAMGSGHFLVEAVDYITDKTLEFLNAFPWNPVSAYLDRMRSTILREMAEQDIAINPSRLTHVNLLKRHVLKRCIFGVDLNPMAVELAKVSLWLDCFTLGAPLSFLDHHIRCGNSLVGVEVDDVRTVLEPKQHETVEFEFFGSPFTHLKLAVGLMSDIGELSDVTSAQVAKSRGHYRKATAELAQFKRLLDVFASHWYDNRPKRESLPGNLADLDKGPAVGFLKSPDSRQFIEAKDANEADLRARKLPADLRRVALAGLESAKTHRFFHWDLEFPEVFYAARAGTRQVIERNPNAGFDAVIGNPPYVRQEGLGDDKMFFAAVHKP
ncbi:MAG: hypothetical protein AAB368_11525, partial [bacterium]